MSGQIQRLNEFWTKMYIWVTKNTNQDLGTVKGLDVFEFFTIITVLEQQQKK